MGPSLHVRKAPTSSSRGREVGATKRAFPELVLMVRTLAPPCRWGTATA